MPKVKVDGIEIEVPPGATVMQACEIAGKEIPRFCYHERLSIAGNCRMCLVEVKPGPPKPQASCALPAVDNQEIFTDTPMVRAAREGVMEFLLINHPLDCPICDQGGECDLQDQAVAYGRGQSRYREPKRAVTEKYMGPIVKTEMTRCIQCTRCVRFAEEVAGVETIGAVFRGENMQITTYLEQAFRSELSGNLVDLCPVGALTARPYAFEARPWELRKTPGIDVMDAVGTNIRIDSRGRQVLRILPRLNDDVNEEWATDKARHAVDGLVRRRLDRPFVRRDGALHPASWAEAFAAIVAAARTAKGKVAAIAGDLVDCETLFAARALVHGLGGNAFEGRAELDYDTSSLSALAFNTGITNVERADLVLLVGTDVRHEAPLVNTRIRKAVRKARARVFGIGETVDLTYPVTWLGTDSRLLLDVPKALSEALDAAERPVMIVGGSALKVAGLHGAALALAQRHGLIRDGWNGFNVLHAEAARMGGLMLGYAYPGGMPALAASRPALVFLLGADALAPSTFADSVTVYIGHHGDRGAEGADVVLPGAAYTEKSGTYVNCEGRVQRGERAVFPPGDAREDWTILRALSDALAAAGLGAPLPFDDLAGLREAMGAAVPALAQEGLVDFGWSAPDLPATPEGPIPPSPLSTTPGYYLNNALCRASPTMHLCSEALAPETPASEVTEAAA